MKVLKKGPLCVCVVCVVEELFVSPSGMEQWIVGGGGMAIGRRGRHPLETVRFVHCVKASSARD